MKERCYILIVGDHPLVQRAVAQFIENQPDLAVGDTEGYLVKTQSIAPNLDAIRHGLKGNMAPRDLND